MMNANWSSMARIGCLLCLLAACNPLQVVSPTLPAETPPPPTATLATADMPASPFATLAAVDSPAPQFTSPPAQQPEMEATQMTPPTPPAYPSGLESLVEQAKGDLAQRLSIEVNEISLKETREVVWSDASLGCPQPGIAYTEVNTPGYWILLEASGSQYPYHSDRGAQLVLCQEESSPLFPVKPGEIDDGEPWMPN